MKRIPLVVSGLSLAAGLVLGGGLPAGATTGTGPVTTAGQPLSCSTSSSDPAQAAVCQRAKDAGLTHQQTIVFPEFWGDNIMDVCKYGGSIRVAYAPGSGTAMTLGYTSKLWAPSTGRQCAPDRKGEVTMSSALADVQIAGVIQDGVYRWATTAQPLSSVLSGLTVKMWWNDSLGGESRSAKLNLAS